MALHVAVSRPELLAAVMALDPVGAADDGGLTGFSEALTARAAPERRERLEQLHAIPDAEATEADHLELMRIVWPWVLRPPRFGARDAEHPRLRRGVGGPVGGAGGSDADACG